LIAFAAQSWHIAMPYQMERVHPIRSDSDARNFQHITAAGNCPSVKLTAVKKLPN